MDISGGRRSRGNLPVEVTSLVGRRHDSAEVRRLLSTARLVTLIGIGGVGKTRLALGVGTELRRAFPDGVWLLEFAELADPALVAHMVAEALRVTNHPGQSSAEAVVKALGEASALLVFDNCEHLIEPCAHLAEQLLHGAHGVRILATSRQPLGVTGEHCWPVAPLVVPDPDHPMETGSAGYSALALFEQRAAAAVPGFTVTAANQATVATICRELDGLPLAIELAAARLRALSLDQLLTRLSNRYKLLTSGRTTATPRQQTLRGAIDWSYDLCTEDERLLWARASVFSGGFDLSAAESVVSDDELSADDVLDLLHGLVDKSIMLFGGDRYRMLETVRSYGAQKLRESGAEQRLRRAHRDWYWRQAKQAADKWFSTEQVHSYARMKAEHANLRSALEFCLSTEGEARAGMYLGAVLWFFWSPADLISEGRHWLTRALALDPAPSPERLHALWVAGRMAVLQGENETAMTLLEECRAEAVRMGDDSAFAHAVYVIGLNALRNDNLPVATVLLAEAVARFQALGEINGVTVISRGFLAMAHTASGDSDRAVELCQESLEICAAHDDQWARAHILYALAHAEWCRGDSRAAAGHALESLKLKRAFDDLIGIAGDVELLGWIAVSEGDHERAARLLGASDRMWPVVGSIPLLGFRELSEARARATEQARVALGRAGFERATESGITLATDLDQLLAYSAGESKPKTARRNGKPASTALTKREREIAELVADGLSNKDIAAALVISQRTAETHVEHILTKLGFTSRAQIAALISEQRVT